VHVSVLVAYLPSVKISAREKYKTLTLQENMEVLNKLDHGGSIQTVMSQYGEYLEGTEKEILVEHLELTQTMFVTDLVKMRMTLETKISHNKSHYLKRPVQVKWMRKIRKQKHEQSSNFQNLNSIISFVHSNP
jgi:hypothetical protein